VTRRTEIVARYLHFFAAIFAGAAAWRCDNLSANQVLPMLFGVEGAQPATGGLQWFSSSSPSWRSSAKC
jgi:hypothetical protein